MTWGSSSLFHPVEPFWSGHVGTKIYPSAPSSRVNAQNPVLHRWWWINILLKYRGICFSWRLMNGSDSAASWDAIGRMDTYTEWINTKICFNAGTEW